MGSGSKQKQQQMSYWDQQTQNNLNQAKQIPADEQAIHDQNMAFLNWENKPGHNIEDAPGMQDYVDIANSALAKSRQERMGTGALNLADNGSQPYIANLKQLHQDEMGQEYGANLENALAARRAEVHGSVLPLASLDTNRALGVADASSGMFGRWAQYQPPTPFWQKALLAGIQGGSQVASAYYGG